MNYLEIIVKLYSLQFRIDNKNCIDNELEELETKFNTVLSQLKPYARGGKPKNSPEDLIQYFKKTCKFYIDYNNNKIRKPDYTKQRYISMIFMEYIFGIDLYKLGKYHNLSHAMWYSAIDYVNNNYETNPKFREYFDKLQIEILGKKSIIDTDNLIKKYRKL
jgi:hypothetical protein